MHMQKTKKTLFFLRICVSDTASLFTVERSEGRNNNNIVGWAFVMIRKEGRR